MSDQPEQPVRRVGRKDRKRSLDSRQPLFPEDNEFAPPELAKTDEVPAELDQPESSPAEPPTQRVSTPAEQRFPPLDPDTFEPKTTQAAPPRRRHGWLYNLLTVFFLLATVAALAYFVLLWTNPYHPLNLLPPYTPLPIIITATPLPLTATFVPIQTEPPTRAPTATFTPLAAADLPAAAAAFPYTLAELDTEYAGSASGCAYSGLAGSVLDAPGAGVDNLTVRVRGEGSDFVAEALTGSAPDFGPGGFEIKLGDTPRLAPFVVQLFGPDDAPLSDEYLVVTGDQCEQNVVLVRFSRSIDF